MYFRSLKHWDIIRTLDLREAAMLIAGVDPTRENLHSGETSRVLVYERAIAEAVQRADEFAWQHARELERLSQDTEANTEALAAMRLTNDIWADNFLDFLPTIEMRNSVAAVNADPENVPILLPIDPWYTASVFAADLNSWVKQAGIESAYRFADGQQVIVTSREENWDAAQDKPAPAEANIPLESVNAFAERAELLTKPLATRERNILLAIIAALCTESKIDYRRHAKAAGLIKDLTASMGINVGESTIEGHLRKIPDALQSRMK